MISETIDLLILGMTDSTVLAMLLLLLDKVDLTTVGLLDEVESVCTEVKILLIDGDIDGEQGIFSRKQSKIL